MPKPDTNIPMIDGMDARAAKMAAETLSGDVRNLLLADMKDPKNNTIWSLRGEKGQREAVDRANAFAIYLIERVVSIVAAGGRKTIQADLKKVHVGESIRADLELSRTDEQRHQLMDACGSKVLIVIAEAGSFIGERAPVVIDKDQPAMFDDSGEDGEDGNDKARDKPAPDQPKDAA